MAPEVLAWTNVVQFGPEPYVPYRISLRIQTAEYRKLVGYVAHWFYVGAF